MMVFLMWGDAARRRRLELGERLAGRLVPATLFSRPGTSARISFSDRHSANASGSMLFCGLLGDVEIVDAVAGHVAWLHVLRPGRCPKRQLTQRSPPPLRTRRRATLFRLARPRSGRTSRRRVLPLPPVVRDLTSASSPSVIGLATTQPSSCASRWRRSRSAEVRSATKRHFLQQDFPWRTGYPIRWRVKNRREYVTVK